MVSLINKQLLFTAYAYLFTMEHQGVQQGSEALQLRVEQGGSGRTKTEGEEEQACPTAGEQPQQLTLVQLVEKLTALLNEFGPLVVNSKYNQNTLDMLQELVQYYTTSGQAVPTKPFRLNKVEKVAQNVQKLAQKVEQLPQKVEQLRQSLENLSQQINQAHEPLVQQLKLKMQELMQQLESQQSTLQALNEKTGPADC